MMYDLTPDTTAERLRQLAHFVEGLPHGTEVLGASVGLSDFRVHIDDVAFFDMHAGKEVTCDGRHLSYWHGDFLVVAVMPGEPSRTHVVPAKAEQ
jgi:hypothetical protein